MTGPTWPEVLGRVNETAGTQYQLLRPLTGGRQGGAWLVRDDSASAPDRVLTWSMNAGLAARRDQTAGLVHALRERGYPTPRWHAWGGLPDGLAFVIADWFDGEPASWDDLAPTALIDVVERQADLARPGPSWNDYMRAVLASDEGPRHDVAVLGGGARGFLRLIDRGARRLDATELPAADAVHGDLEAGNILTARVGSSGGLGVIDIDACGPGTRAIDYAWLVRDATSHAAPKSTVAELRRAGIAVAGSEVWSACLAFACLELVAFVARSANTRGAGQQIERLTPLLVSP